MIYEIPRGADEVPTLDDYLRAIRNRWRLIVGITVLAFLGAIVLDASRTDTFEAKAKVVVNPTNSNATNANLIRPVLERESEIMASNGVAARAAADLNDPITPVALLTDLDVRFTNDSDTLEIIYSSEDASEAALRANAMVNAYVDQREEASLSIYDTQIELLGAEQNEFSTQIDEVVGEIAETTTQRNNVSNLGLTSAEASSRVASFNQTISALNVERGSLNSALTAVTRELRDVELEKESRDTTAEVIQFADTPTAPAGISGTVLIAALTLLGGAAGVAAAFIRDRLDRRAKDASEVEVAIGASVLGSIPFFGIGARGGAVMLGSAKNARMQRVRESYRRIRASLQFLQTSRDVETLVITSAHPEEGKTTFTANLAVAAAQAGSKVAIVSADLRRPAIENMFGLTADRGLSTFLQNPEQSNVLLPVPDVPGLILLPAGPPPPNPGDLLSSPVFAELLAELRTQHDLVLIDMPPVFSAADASTVAAKVDGVLVVVDSRKTDTDDLLKVRVNLEQSGAEIVGSVLNRDNSAAAFSLRRDRYAYEKAAAAR